MNEKPKDVAGIQEFQRLIDAGATPNEAIAAICFKGLMETVSRDDSTSKWEIA